MGLVELMMHHYDERKDSFASHSFTGSKCSDWTRCSELGQSVACTLKRVSSVSHEIVRYYFNVLKP